jgi:peptidoglycan/LPS O-acetylase OafA/YrhL
VLAYHGGMSWAKGGFLGVDAFFVLSGYLITSLLLAESQGGGIGLVAFWSRRARRLLPALFLMLAGVGFYTIVFAQPVELGTIRNDAIATIAYVANWRQIFSGQSYFQQFLLPSPLIHTWSLAIEEQYYIVWPLLLTLLLGWRRISIRGLLAVTALLVMASAVLMGLLFNPDGDPSRAYYGTDTRAQSLLVGGALAMLFALVGPVRDRLAGALLQIGGLQCAAVIGFLWVTTSGDNAFLYRGGFLFLALAVAVIIAAVVQPDAGPLGRALALPPLRALGLISYGVYLWHWPVFMMITPGRLDLGEYPLFGVRVVTTIAVATVSYYLIEMPIRRGAFRRLRVRWSFAPVGAVALAVGLIFVTRGGASLGEVMLGQALTVKPMPKADPAAQPPPKRVMVVGDSVAKSIMPTMEKVAPQRDLLVWDATTAGCGFIEADLVHDPTDRLSAKQAERCRDWHADWPEQVESFRPDIVVSIFGIWDSFAFNVDGRVLEPGSPEWTAYVLDTLESDLEVFTAGGAKIVLATYPFPFPMYWSMLPNADELARDVNQRVTALNDLYREFAARHPGKVVLLDLNGFVCPEHKASSSLEGVKITEDGTHFNQAGAFLVAEWMLPQIANATAVYGP